MNYLPNWGQIRAHYSHVPPEIFTARDEWAIDPYAWDERRSGISLSPIEWAMWGEIRMANLILYPQFPVSRFFVDFANPAAKVAIECDGAAYHQDHARDGRRQAEIETLGWTVYRFTGSQCVALPVETIDEQGESRFAQTFVRSSLLRIGKHHQISRFAQGDL